MWAKKCSTVRYSNGTLFLPARSMFSFCVTPRVDTDMHGKATSLFNNTTIIALIGTFRWDQLIIGSSVSFHLLMEVLNNKLLESERRKQLISSKCYCWKKITNGKLVFISLIFSNSIYFVIQIIYFRASLFRTEVDWFL